MTFHVRVTKLSLYVQACDMKKTEDDFKEYLKPKQPWDDRIELYQMVEAECVSIKARSYKYSSRQNATLICKSNVGITLVTEFDDELTLKTVCVKGVSTAIGIGMLWSIVLLMMA